jgi:F-type H+-transporting ATPase subunit delta
VTSRGGAVRYARALFDISLAEGKDLLQTQRDLGDFARLVAESDPLLRALTNPAIPALRKRGVVEQLIARAGSLQPVVVKLLLLLAERDRLALLPEVAQAFDERVMDHQGIVKAEIVSAAALSADSVTAITNGLKRATGRDIRIETRVDSTIIGGAVARIGGTVYDGSVSRQLERMRETLTRAVD